MNLNQVTLFTRRFDKSLEFYKTLGLRLIVDSAPRYVRFECPDGDSTFSLHSIDEMTENNRVAVYFECDDVDAEYQRLKDRRIEFEHAPVDQDWLWREARLKDPDGNELVLYTAGENRKNPPWKVRE